MLDTALLWTIDAVTVKMVVCAVSWLDALVFHVLSARLCGVLLWMVPRTGDAGLVEGGWGQSRRRDTPAQRFNPALGPGS